MSIAMRWEAFKARRRASSRSSASSASPAANAEALIAPQPDEPPHSLRQHFAVSTRTLTVADSNFDIYSVAPMKFGGDHGAESEAFNELAPADAARQAILYVLPGGFAQPIKKRNWDFIATLANAGYRVDSPLYGLIPQHSVQHGVPLILESYTQLIRDHGAENVHVIGDSAGGGLALAALTSPYWTADEREQLNLPPANTLAPLPTPRSLLLNAPWVDIALSNPALADVADRDPLLDPLTLRRQGALWSRISSPSGTHDLSSEHPAVSPLFVGNSSLQEALSGTEVHIWCGDADISLPDARALAQKTGAELHEVTGALHMFHLGNTPEGKAARRSIVEIIDRL
ncbi:alpha/beta hydrolase [Corynebacterium zhongnanshanii]|uniref:Alpha/beta hydrolase n=1 Tax=Corynebacterium zhongnanshanii TaxID=2768834 RepID=A0ABQ6VCP8_9CORY|nr:alpha/beta hydrolase [Corynebacterium zhongnanshanii]KAB3519940.1 alpha/beta hydrolase [Corynebacterium zhongnanshanii]